MGKTKKRRPILALILSLLTPGLGQLYNGQAKRGITLYLIGIFLVSIFFSGLYSKFVYLFLFLVLGLFFVLFSIIDALYQARNIKNITLRTYNQWYLYIVIIACQFLIIATSAYVDLIPFKLYRIPSSSMAPTLLPGDYFFIDKKYYRDKKPKRGEIVVFQSPVDPSKDFIKRVVGLPGEAIGFNRSAIFINNKFLKEPYLNQVESEYGSSQVNSKIILGPVKIPVGKIFVLGDNRDESNDSRNYGPVKFSFLQGKALYIIWAKEKIRIGNKVN